MKSALFVDFDNIYSGLRQLDQATADRFARSPMNWVNWMVSTLALPEHVAATAKRRILVRRCYLNPQAYQRFRPFFNLAGFEIVDCPALTSGGKTSTDIHMVLDIIDLLAHEAHYDEFIVLSADADFTPVLRKLRRWDRRTTVLAIGFPSAAYRASADLVIDQDVFVRDALGIGRLEKNHTNAAPPLLLARPVDTTKATAREERATAPPVVPVAGSTTKPDRVTLNEMAKVVLATVDESPEPVSCARLAGILASQREPNDDWHGYGSFRLFLDAMPLPNLVCDWQTHGGVLFDPLRHRVEPADPGSSVDADWLGEENALGTARQIQEVTGVPLLSPSRYALFFAELEADVAANGYDFIETTKRVRSRCRDHGQPISRADITFILRGIVLRGHDFAKHVNSAAELGQQFCNNVRSMCLREQIQLDAATEAAIRRWLCRGVRG